ncbi:hypothetical protein J437_LFUL000304 [Ladona fulva]|uniref:Leucine-rich repeat-containing protein 51 n=1 Tax=Ladona fulva TaxID=123851 RepID=A0A8K0P0U0_LADFU|nr:hypothetical protein J437_LFUL000304 [Ladona fulva]
MEVSDLKYFVQKTLEQPHLLGWLDLSSNYLDKVPSELIEFPNLCILYLHGNIIQKLVYVKRLIPLKKLYSLTMHGNPVEDDAHYKNYILHFLPQLKTLDFITVLPCERMVPPPPPAVLAEEEPAGFTGTEEEMLSLLKKMKS